MATKEIRRRGILYGFLIDIHEKYYNEGSELIIREVKRAYPEVYIGRNDRFLKTIQRIVSPTLPSSNGKVSISGDSVDNYRRKIWIPRTRNFSKKLRSNILLMNNNMHSLAIIIAIIFM